MEANSKIEALQSAVSNKQAKERSTIEFPYLDLENSFEITTGIYEIGGSSCDWDQLAAHLKQAAQGGGFRLRMICAKQFGLVTYDRGKANLTALGLRMVDPQQLRAARVEAFLNIALYRAIYDRFRGGTLPPQAGLEREMVSLGVSAKQSDKARLAFFRSAKWAGFFEFGADRLVSPANVNSAPDPLPSTDAVEAEKQKGGGGNGGGNGAGIDLNLDPLLLALLQKIPAQGVAWPIEKRLRWFKTFAMNVSQVYDEDENPIELIIKITDD